MVGKADNIMEVSTMETVLFLLMIAFFLGLGLLLPPVLTARDHVESLFRKHDPFWYYYQLFI